MPTVTYSGECDCCTNCDCACPACNDHDPCVYHEQYQVIIDGYVENVFSCPGDCDCSAYNGTFTLTRGTGPAACLWCSAEMYSSDFCPDNPCTIGAPLWCMSIVDAAPGFSETSLSPCATGGGAYFNEDPLCQGGDVTGGQTGTAGCCGRGSVLFPYTFTITPIGSAIDCTEPPPMALRDAVGNEIEGPRQPRRVRQPKGKLRVRVAGKVYEGEWKDGKATLTDPNPDPAPPGYGPGTELKAMLRGTEAAGCGCNQRADLMDRLGVEGCRARLPEVVGWLDEAWGRLPWYKKLRAAGKAVLAGHLTTESLVLEAVRRAEAKGPPK